MDHNSQWTSEHMIFLGIELEWATKGEDTTFSMGLHFRDMHYLEPPLHQLGNRAPARHLGGCQPRSTLGRGPGP